LVLPAEASADERRIPVPVPTTVVAPAQVLLEAAQVGRAGPVRVLALDGVGALVERSEAVVHVLGHERPDAHASLLFGARRDVDEHKCSRDVEITVLTDRGERRESAERRADERGRSTEGADDR